MNATKKNYTEELIGNFENKSKTAWGVIKRLSISKPSHIELKFKNNTISNYLDIYFNKIPKNGT